MSGIGLTPWGSQTALNITAATVVKTGRGVIIRAQVITAGSTTGAIYDTTTTTGGTIANQVAVVLGSEGTYYIGMPCTNGIMVVPGTGQTLAVSYQ